MNIQMVVLSQCPDLETEELCSFSPLPGRSQIEDDQSRKKPFQLCIYQIKNNLQNKLRHL
jgi:hypothetical protein